MRIEISGLRTIPDVRRGDDLAALIRRSAELEGRALDRATLAAVAQKVVSKAEGAMVDLREVQASAMAQRWAAQWGKDPRLIEVILSESRRIVRMDRGVLITETRLGFVCANAGVDQSNTEGDDVATILPRDPDASARRLRAALGLGAVIVTDTFGRPWREGLADIAIGAAGLEPLEDYRGCPDRRGRKLASTVIAVADQLAAAAGLVMRKSNGSPVALIRGFDWRPGEGSAQTLIRPAERDLFR